MAPDVPDTHFNLGLLYREIGKSTEAIESLSKAVEIEPAFIEARLALAELLFEQDELESAEQEYEEVLRIEPGHAGATRSLEVIRARGDH